MWWWIKINPIPFQVWFLLVLLHTATHTCKASRYLLQHPHLFSQPYKKSQVQSKYCVILGIFPLYLNSQIHMKLGTLMLEEYYFRASFSSLLGLYASCLEDTTLSMSIWQWRANEDMTSTTCLSWTKILTNYLLYIGKVKSPLQSILSDAWAISSTETGKSPLIQNLVYLNSCSQDFRHIVIMEVCSCPKPRVWLTCFSKLSGVNYLQ